MAKQSFEQYARELMRGGRDDARDSTQTGNSAPAAAAQAAAQGTDEPAAAQKPAYKPLDDIMQIYEPAPRTKQNVVGNALFDAWREPIEQLGAKRAEQSADMEALQAAYQTANGKYSKAKKAESAAKEKMKTAPSDAVAEKYREGYESARAAREAAEAEFDRSKAQLESAGVELPDTSTWGRIKHLFAGTSLERLGSDVGAMRGLYEAGQKGRTAQYQQAYDELQPQIARAQTAYDEMRKLYGEAGATAEYNALKDLQQKSDAYKKVLDENIQQRATAATSEMANSLTETGGAKLEEAKQGLSPIGRVGVDAASAGLNMLYDAALGRFGGSTLSKAAMGLRSFGQTVQAAEAADADIGRQIGAGAAATAKSIIINKFTDGLAGLYGKGAADDIIETVIGKLGKTDAGRNALRVLAKSAGEGAEELVDAKLDPLVSLIYDNGAALEQKYGSGWQGYKEAAADDLYSALIGFTLGAAGQGVSAARGAYSRANAQAAQAQAAPVQTEAASAESRAPAQGTQEAPGRTKPTREQRKAAKEQAFDEFTQAQFQYYEEHGWEAALPKELESKNVDKWVKARTTAILKENAARTSSDAEAAPEAEAQEGISAPPAAQDVKQGDSDALNSPSNLNSMEEQTTAPAEAQKNTAPTQETESTAVNDDPAKHTPEEQARIEEYKAATDENLVNYIETVRNNPGAKIGRYSLKPVSDKAAADIKALTGVDVSGNKTVIEPRIIEHILKRHGEGGAANSSMRDVNDIARIQYVIDNYDNVEDGGRSSAYQTIKPNGKPGQAQTVKFSKAINGTYYVIEAVPDTKAKTVFVTSAYLSNKKAGDLQTANAEATRVTSETKNAQSPVYETSSRPGSPQASGVTGDVSTTSIPTNEQNVNGGSAGNAERERGFSKNVRTDNAMEPKIRESFDTAPETYKQLANKDTLAKAEEIFARGLDEARGEVEQALGAAKSGSKLAPEMVPLARMVANELSKNGNVESARRILADVAAELTAAGQLGQAGRILRDSDPNTALASIQKSIDAINAEFEKQHKRSKWRAELTEAETQEILSTDFTESDAYERIYEKVATRLGKEMPSSVLEKLTEIRRINMLLRPRTQIKNIASNVPMVGLRKGAETLSIGIQSALTRMGLMEKADRTRAWASKEQRQMARDYYDANKADINGQSNKWDLKTALREKRTIFKGGAIEKAVSKMTGKEIDSFGEALRQVTYNCLEKGDAPFVKSAFVDSLAQYCAAKGITSSENITQEAIDFATANAMEATFKNANVIAQSLNTIKRNSSPAVSASLDILIPFTTTPANILSLMGDYSPVGFGKVFAKGGPAEKIDAFSKASVGTAMLALGFALRNAGWITGGEDDDKDKAALDKATGQGTYSVGGKVSYDWAQPVGSLLAFGAEIADAVRGQESWDSALMNAIYTAGDATLNLSLFQNIISVLRGSGKPTEQIIDAIMEGGATQLVPGLAGDIAKLIDGTVRSTYTGGNVFDDIGAKTLAATPVLSKKLPESVNVKGETNTRGEFAERAVNTLLNPTNITRGKRNAVDEEIYRLYDATGSAVFFPSVSPYKIEYDNQTYTMNGKDRETFQKTQGQTYYELAQPLLGSEMYKALNDEQKAAVLKSIRDYALDAAKRQFVDGRGGEYSNTQWDPVAELSKGQISTYIPAKQALKDGANSKGGEKTYDAIDLLLDGYKKLPDAVQDRLMEENLNIGNLLYADSKGIGSKAWYDTHNAIDGTGAVAAASAVSRNFKGGDKEKLDALRTMNSYTTPDKETGKQSAIVRRYEAAMNYGVSFDDWTRLEETIVDMFGSGTPNKSEIYAAAKEALPNVPQHKVYNLYKKDSANEKKVDIYDMYFADLYEPTGDQLANSVSGLNNADDAQSSAQSSTQSGANQRYTAMDYLLAETLRKTK